MTQILDDNEGSHANENYYWVSSFPFSSKEELPGRETDEELRRLVISKLKSIPQIDSSKVDVNVVDQIVSITGSVQTYKQKRRIGKEIWKIGGIAKVLNELHVRAFYCRSDTKRLESRLCINTLI
jgi:osmotically-inducible protein OsmY